MKLKNKYSKQNIYNNPNFPRKHFPENQAKFSFDWKVFFVDQLS